MYLTFNQRQNQDTPQRIAHVDFRVALIFVATDGAAVAKL